YQYIINTTKCSRRSGVTPLLLVTGMAVTCRYHRARLLDRRQGRSSNTSVVEGERAAFGELVDRWCAFDLGCLDELGAFQAVGLDADGAGEESAASVDVLLVEVEHGWCARDFDGFGEPGGCELHAVFGQPHDDVLVLAESFDAHEVADEHGFGVVE